MSRLSSAPISVAALLVLAVPVAAAAFGLRPFGTGDVTVSNEYSVTIVNDAGELGGVIVRVPRGHLIGDVDLHFVSTGDELGDSPRWVIPIDTDGHTRTVEGHAIIAASTCPVSDTSVLVATFVPCPVTFDFTADAYPSWSAVVDAHPTWRIASGESAVIVADEVGTFVIWYPMGQRS